MKKILVRTIIGLVILLVAAVAIIWLLIDPIAGAAVERGATYALGVQTQLTEIDVSLLRGEVTMDGLNVANPEGFETPHLMHSGRFGLGVRTGSLFTDTVEVRHFELDGLDVNIEQKLTGSNVSKVMDNLKRLGGKDEGEKPEEDAGGKKVKVDRILIKNVKAHFHLLPSLTSAGTLTVEVPEIKLEKVSSDEGGVVVAELVRRLVPAILTAVVKKGEGTVPEGFLRDLDGQVGELTSALGDQAGKLVKQVEGRLGEALGEGGQRAVGELEKGAKKGIGDLKERLLGGDKEPQESED